jgi:hypothetical protein
MVPSNFSIDLVMPTASSADHAGRLAKSAATASDILIVCLFIRDFSPADFLFSEPDSGDQVPCSLDHLIDRVGFQVMLFALGFVDAAILCLFRRLLLLAIGRCDCQGVGQRGGADHGLPGDGQGHRNNEYKNEPHTE